MPRETELFGSSAAKVSSSMAIVPEIGALGARQDLNQGGFAAAVLTGEAEDLAGADAQAHLGQRPNAGKRLADGVNPDERRGHRGTSGLLRAFRAPGGRRWLRGRQNG